jgi:hypothetical protein
VNPPSIKISPFSLSAFEFQKTIDIPSSLSYAKGKKG